MKKPIAVTALAVALAAPAFLWLWPEDGVGRIDPADPVQVALGRAVYAEHCAACHGANLEGEPDWQVRRPTGELPAPPHDVTGHTWHHSDAVLFEITRNGLGKFAPPDYRTNMPAFADILSDDQIRAVLAYIKSTWPDEIRKRQSAME